jgi:uncharacterized iron-regulated membrane protein
MKGFKTCLILAHRYLGIALSLLIVTWFASGIVMMYAGGMPRLTAQLRLDRLPALDLSRVRLTPSDAAEHAGADTTSGRVVLLSVMDRPAYRFGGGRTTTVFADSGEVLENVSLEQSRTIASRFMNLAEDKIHYVRTLTSEDQWTLGQGRQMPLHKFRADDESRSELYVAPRTGEVTVFTTRQSRTLAWMGTIPHWLYFAALRANQPLWYRIVVWTSELACVLAVLGLILGVTQYRRSKPLRLSLPYSGWMRWHYVTGVVFGLFTLTWAFSGLLSMEPFAWTRATGLDVSRDALTGGPVDLSRFAAMDPAAWTRVLGGRGIKEVEFARIQDEHYYVVRQAPDEQTSQARRERLHQPYNVTGSAEPDRVLVAANTLEIRREPFSVDSLMTRLKAELPDVPIVESQLLSDYDSYYYSRGRLTPLPVLRVKFADAAQTWVYIDPGMSQVLAQIHRLNRVERWLYNGLHSLDFSFWYDRRPLWDIGMITLCLGGFASSGIGLLLAVKRVRRGVTRTARSLVVVPPASEPRNVASGSTQ